MSGSSESGYNLSGYTSSTNTSSSASFSRKDDNSKYFEEVVVTKDSEWNIVNARKVQGKSTDPQPRSSRPSTEPLKNRKQKRGKDVLQSTNGEDEFDFHRLVGFQLNRGVKEVKIEWKKGADGTIYRNQLIPFNQLHYSNINSWQDRIISVINSVPGTPLCQDVLERVVQMDFGNIENILAKREIKVRMDTFLTFDWGEVKHFKIDELLSFHDSIRAIDAWYRQLRERVAIHDRNSIYVPEV